MLYNRIKVLAPIITILNFASCETDEKTPYEYGAKCVREIMIKCGLDKDGNVENADCSMQIMMKYSRKQKKFTAEERKEFERGMHDYLTAQTKKELPIKN